MLIATDFSDYITETNANAEINWEQTIYWFPNGYGVSVVEGGISYGLEAAVLALDPESETEMGWIIDYTTPAANDVVGYLDAESLAELLGKVRDLPKLGILELARARRGQPWQLS